MTDKPDLLNGIHLTGRVIDEPLRAQQFLWFRLSRTRTAKEPSQLFQCRIYIPPGEVPAKNIQYKGDIIEVKGTLHFGTFQSPHGRHVDNLIEVEETRLAEGEPKNSIKLNGTIYGEPAFGRENKSVRFTIDYHNGMCGFSKRCVMFAPKDGRTLPMAILKANAEIAIHGHFFMNTFNNPNGSEEIIVDEMLSDKKYITDIRFVENKDEKPSRAVTVTFHEGKDINIIPRLNTYGIKGTTFPSCAYPFHCLLEPLANACKDWLHGAEQRPDIRPFICLPPKDVAIRVTELGIYNPSGPGGGSAA